MEHHKRPRRATLYARSDVESQAEPTVVQLQMRALRHLAQARGWQVVNAHTEIACAHQRPRPELEKILASAGRGEFDILVVTHLNRLFQDISQLWGLVQVLALDRVSVVSFDSPGQLDQG